jgi:hypothetical protein
LQAKLTASDVDTAVSKLPALLQDRIKGFRSRNPDFRWKYEPYELFCCQQGALMFQTLKTTAAIEAFAKADYNVQLSTLPGFDDNHSGNTLAASLALAHALASDQPELVVKAHAAICPVVGCKEVGCPAGQNDAE